MTSERNVFHCFLTPPHRQFTCFGAWPSARDAPHTEAGDARAGDGGRGEQGGPLHPRAPSAHEQALPAAQGRLAYASPLACRKHNVIADAPPRRWRARVRAHSLAVGAPPPLSHHYTRHTLLDTPFPNTLPSAPYIYIYIYIYTRHFLPSQATHTKFSASLAAPTALISRRHTGDLRGSTTRTATRARGAPPPSSGSRRSARRFFSHGPISTPVSHPISPRYTFCTCTRHINSSQIPKRGNVMIAHSTMQRQQPRVRRLHRSFARRAGASN